LPTTNDILSNLFSRVGVLDDKDAAAIARLPSREIVLKRDSDVSMDGDWVFVLLDGWVCGYKLLSAGGRQICSIHIHGDAPHLGRLLPLDADLDYRTLSDCRLGLVPAQPLRDLFHRSVVISRAVLREISISACIAEEWIANIGRRRAIMRVAHLLCELACRLDAAHGKPQKAYIIPLTQADLADATGLSTVHVNRVLQELRGRRLVEFNGGHLSIPDWGRLVEVAAFDQKYLHLDRVRYCTL
jgi:CRP-like cAMP-binding protein